MELSRAAIYCHIRLFSAIYGRSVGHFRLFSAIFGHLWSFCRSFSAIIAVVTVVLAVRMNTLRLKHIQPPIATVCFNLTEYGGCKTYCHTAIF